MGKIFACATQKHSFTPCLVLTLNIPPCLSPRLPWLSTHLQIARARRTSPAAAAARRAHSWIAEASNTETSEEEDEDEGDDDDEEDDEEEDEEGTRRKAGVGIRSKLRAHTSGSTKALTLTLRSVENNKSISLSPPTGTQQNTLHQRNRTDSSQCVQFAQTYMDENPHGCCLYTRRAAHTKKNQTNGRQAYVLVCGPLRGFVMVRTKQLRKKQGRTARFRKCVHKIDESSEPSPMRDRMRVWKDSGRWMVFEMPITTRRALARVGLTRCTQNKQGNSGEWHVYARRKREEKSACGSVRVHPRASARY